MTKSTLLDDYLNGGTTPPLTDTELDQQLYQAQTQPAPTPSPRPAAHAATTPKPQQDAESLLSAAFSQFQERQDAEETIDRAVKTASHGVKVLTPLVRAVSQWVDPKTQGDELERIIGTLLGRVRKDALLVAQAYGVTPEAAPPWLTSQISGQLMDILISAVERNNGVVLNEQDTSYLAPLLNLAEQAEGISASIYAQPHDTSWQLINALTVATAAVMTEYHVFSYFHPDPRPVSQLVTDYLNARVIDGSLQQLATRFNLTEGERGYLGNTLLNGAGKLLANAWTKSMGSTLQMVKEMPIDTRRDIVVSGYPLDLIFEDFEGMYQALELSAESAIRSLSPHRESLNRGQSHGQSLR
ncbi:hypothetical protein SSTU70S_04755 [Stutzerimonas stutzeri]